MFQAEVREINKTLGQHEEIKRFRLVADSWSAQTGELSQTLKLKRKVLEQKYSDLIEEIFASSRED
jgi:long-chain acyl-CoA synthetase